MTNNNHEWAMNSKTTPNDRQIRSSEITPPPEPEGQSALDDVHYEWELEDYEGEWQAGGSANSLEDAQRDGMRYLQIYTQDGFHRLIIRRHCTKIIQEINNA